MTNRPLSGVATKGTIPKSFIWYNKFSINLIIKMAMSRTIRNNNKQYPGSTFFNLTSSDLLSFAFMDVVILSYFFDTIYFTHT